MIKRLLCGLLAMVALAPSTMARPLDQVKETGTLRVAVYREFAPFSSGPENALTGIDVDLGAAIAKALGVKVEYLYLGSGESVDDDLRNGVWKGHYLGGGVADVMLHVPLDRGLSERNDMVAIANPYFRETVAVVINPEKTSGSDLVTAFGDPEHKLGVIGDTIGDLYAVGAYGGVIRPQVTHFKTLEELVDAFKRGDVAGMIHHRAELEGALFSAKATSFRFVTMPLPGLQNQTWPLAMAVHVKAHDLSYAIEPIVKAMIKDGRMEKLFKKHGVTYRPAIEEMSQ